MKLKIINSTHISEEETGLLHSSVADQRHITFLRDLRNPEGLKSGHHEVADELKSLYFIKFLNISISFLAKNSKHLLFFKEEVNVRAVDSVLTCNLSSIKFLLLVRLKTSYDINTQNQRSPGVGKAWHGCDTPPPPHPPTPPPVPRQTSLTDQNVFS